MLSSLASVKTINSVLDALESYRFRESFDLEFSEIKMLVYSMT